MLSRPGHPRVNDLICIHPCASDRDQVVLLYRSLSFCFYVIDNNLFPSCKSRTDSREEGGEVKENSECKRSAACCKKLQMDSSRSLCHYIRNGFVTFAATTLQMDLSRSLYHYITNGFVTFSLPPSQMDSPRSLYHYHSKTTAKVSITAVVIDYHRCFNHHNVIVTLLLPPPPSQ